MNTLLALNLKTSLLTICGSLEIKPMFYGSRNLGGQGNLLMIFLSQAVFDRAVVEGLQRDLLALHDSIFSRQFFWIFCSMSGEIRRA